MTVTLTINGQAITADDDMSVLEAARANHIHIPTLCYDPRLPVAGACRLCVVEIDKMRGYPTACTTPVAEGMVVRTETEALQNLRRETLSLILSEHPYTCLVCKDYCGIFHGGTIRKAAVTTGCQYCPANGQCELQGLVEYLDMHDIPYPITYRGLPVEKHDPFFDRDYNLCILCGRCVRACQEVRHAGVLAFVNRGSQTIVGTAFGQSHLETNCQFCGACVDTCPTGALADKRGKWEGAPEATIPSLCPYCSVGCAVNMQVKEGRVIRAVGHGDGASNDGQLCVRGRFGMVDIIHNLNRLKTPLVRREGRLVEASWEEALGLAAEKLGQYQGDQVSLVASAAETNETNYALQKFARTVLHSNNIALPAGFPEHDSTDGLLDTLKYIDGPAIRQIREAACLVTIGANLYDSHPILGLEIRHALSKGASLIAIDTRQTKQAQAADVWLQPRIAADPLLLAGLIKTLLDNGLAAGVETMLPDLSGLSPDEIAAQTGVSPQALAAAAGRLMKHVTIAHNGSGPAKIIIIYGSGVTHHPTAMDTLKAIRSLARLLDNAGIIGVPGEGNFVGAYDMGAHPALLPGYAAVTDAAARARFETAWGATLNPEPGRSYEAVLDGIRTGAIKALYLAGETPPLPELDQLEFLMVQDIIKTDILQQADVILPTTTFAEIDGSLTNLEGRVQRLQPAIEPVGLSRPGWLIVQELAQRLGHDNWTYQAAADVLAEIGSLLPAYAAIKLDALPVGGQLRRFEPASEPQLEPFGLNGGPPLTDGRFPLTLITERNLLYYHGACLTEEVDGLNLIKSEEVLYLNPADAERLAVADGDLVKVVSAYGSAECIVELANGLMPEGAVFASFNRVNKSSLFPTLSPRAKACAIRIEK
ncbi:MAG: molybdopterin-dependent oxidoreductase [Chloroflexota bacterium]